MVEIDQNMIHSSYQSAINLKDTVKLSMTPSEEKNVEGTVSLRKAAFSALLLSSNEGSSSSNLNRIKKHPEKL